MAGNAALIAEYSEIHASTDWGGTSIKNLRFLLPHIAMLGPRSILDYGCGKSDLLEAILTPGLAKKSWYDPAIPKHSVLDRGPHDLLISVDMLEHIEDEDLDVILSEMASVSRDALIVVDTRPAKLHLADGRNAHVSLHDHAWWQTRLEQHFGPLVPIRVKRKGRAAFRTWQISGIDTLHYRALRVSEWVKYAMRRAQGIKY